MVVHAGLPLSFWAEAVNTACYTQNRSILHQRLHKTPYELLKGRAPDISYFHVFGCVCFILNQRDKRTKFDSKSDEGIFLGYSAVSKAYRVFNSSRQTIEESAHVKFNEDDFPHSPTDHPACILTELTQCPSDPPTHVNPENEIHEPYVETPEVPLQATLVDTEVHASTPPSTPEAPELSNDSHDVSNPDPLISETDPESPLSSNDTNLRAHRNHPLDQIIGDIRAGIKTRASSNFCLFVNFVSKILPERIHAAILDADWIKAMQEELNEFKRHNVWTLVPRPKDRTIIGTRWVYRNKLDKDGVIIRNKARLVAQGFTQIESIDYGETFAPVARIEAIRLFLAYASYMNFTVYQMDVKTAFLHGELAEEVYLKQPPGFESKRYPDHVYRLDKAVYGLKQAPRAWYDTLTTYLTEQGYRRGAIDNTLFIKESGSHIILAQIYVDDIIFGSTDQKLSTEFATIMANKFEMSMMGKMNFFLGLQIEQQEDGISICQSKYIAELLSKYEFQNVKIASTPMSKATKIFEDPDGISVNHTLYRGMIGSLLYLTASRPDIMFATTMCARFQANPKESHLSAVKRIFRYLKHTQHLGLWYPRDSELNLFGYTDADHAGCTIDRKSTSGGCQFLGNRLISWSSKKQTSVACSTDEAEYVAAGRCCAQIMWIQNQMLDYGLTFTKTPIYCDNTSAIQMTQNPVHHSKTKHIEIRHHFIRDIAEKGRISLHYIPTTEQLADIFTKPLDEHTNNYLITELGMLNLES